MFASVNKLLLFSGGDVLRGLRCICCGVICRAEG